LARGRVLSRERRRSRRLSRARAMPPRCFRLHDVLIRLPEPPSGEGQSPEWQLETLRIARRTPRLALLWSASPAGPPSGQARGSTHSACIVLLPQRHRVDLDQVGDLFSPFLAVRGCCRGCPGGPLFPCEPRLCWVLPPAGTAGGASCLNPLVSWAMAMPPAHGTPARRGWSKVLVILSDRSAWCRILPTAPAGENDPMSQCPFPVPAASLAAPNGKRMVGFAAAARG
jgi:hypothetical protein